VTANALRRRVLDGHLLRAPRVAANQQRVAEAAASESADFDFL
jgi:hypothetical protein